MKANRILAAVLTALCLLGSVASSAEPPIFRLGVCLSLSGGFQESGRKALAGVNIRVNDYNDNPARPYTIELIVRDDRSEPAGAAEAMEELATKEKVTAVIGPLSTTLMNAMLDTARKHEVVVISPSVTSPLIGRNHDWGFRVLFDDTFQGVALARFMARKMEYSKAAVIVNDRFAYATSVADAFRSNFEKEGGKIVAEEHYSWVIDEDKMFDFTEILERLAKAEPEFVLLPVHSTEVAAIIRDSMSTKLKTHFCGGDTWQHENILLSAGNNLDQSYFISGINFDSNTPAMERFFLLFDSSNDPHAQPTSVLGYDAASLLLKALESGTDGKSLKEGLYKIKNFELATGTVTIDPERGSEKTAFIHRIKKTARGFRSAIIDEILP